MKDYSRRNRRLLLVYIRKYFYTHYKRYSEKPRYKHGAASFIDFFSVLNNCASAGAGAIYIYILRELLASTRKQADGAYANIRATQM